jgi:hypothetical protein
MRRISSSRVRFVGEEIMGAYKMKGQTGVRNLC